MPISYTFNPFTGNFDALSKENGFYFIDASSSISTKYNDLIGAVNGSNTVFTVSNEDYTSGELVVYLNGQAQTEGATGDWTETTPSSGTFTFATAPETGDIILVTYFSTVEFGATFYILTEDGDILTTESGDRLRQE